MKKFQSYKSSQISQYTIPFCNVNMEKTFEPKSEACPEKFLVVLQSKTNKNRGVTCSEQSQIRAVGWGDQSHTLTRY